MALRRARLNTFGAMLNNPFWVLGLGTDASPMVVQREAKKIEAMLAIGKAGAEACVTPFGPGKRDVEAVRWAAGELADPARRAIWELWATPIPGPLPATEALPSVLMDAVGWREVTAGVGGEGTTRRSRGAVS